jgi:quinol monooxygenase YgiN
MGLRVVWSVEYERMDRCESLRPPRETSTWLFEGWPNAEAVETMTLTEVDGITTLTDVLKFKDRASLGDHFQGDNKGMQTSFDQLEDLLAALL